MAEGKPLLDHESAGSGGMNRQIEILAADLTETAANTSQDFVLAELEEGDSLFKAAYHLKEAFENTSDAAFNSNTLEVGDTDDPNSALTAKELNKNGTEILASVTPNSLSTVPKAFVADKQVLVRINSMAAKSLVDIDTGRLVVQCQIGRLSQFERV